MLKLEDISKKYSDGTLALKNINLQFNDIGLIYIKGMSGSGKTTLLNLLSGITKPSTGDVLYNGVNIEKNKNYLRDNVTYIGQEHNLISFLSVKDNLCINSTLSSLREHNAILDKIGVNKLLEKSISQISGGEAKRVEIANSLINDSNIVLCDEPLNSLDSNNSKIIMDLLKTISKKKLVILTGHNVDFISKYADRIIEIENGIVKNDITKNCFNEDSKLSKKQKINGFLFGWGLFRNKIKKNFIYIFLFFILNSLLFLGLNSIINQNQIVSHALISENNNRTYVFSDFDDRKISEAIDKNKTSKNFTLTKTYYKNNEPLRISNIYLPNENLYYEVLNYNLKFSIINKDTFLSDDIIIGNIPKNGNEILVSEYFLHCLEDLGIIENAFDATKEQYLEIDDYEFKIVGYLKQDIKRFDFLKSIYNTTSDKQSILYNIFNSGISTKDTLYVLASFEDYVECDNYEISFMTYASNNYYELLFIKNTFNNSSFFTEDMFSSFVNNYSNIISLVKNISIILSIILSVLILFVNIDYINHVIITYEKDFHSLYYYGCSRFCISNIIFVFMLFLNLLSIIFGIICGRFIMGYINSFVSKIICLDIVAFNYDIYNTIVIFCIQCIVYLCLSIGFEKRLNKQFIRQFE